MTSQSSSNPQILIVEDDRWFMTILERVLIDLGYDQIIKATTFEEACTLFEENEIEIAVVDVNLGGDKTGIEAAKQIKSIEDIPIIFMTSSYFDEVYEEAKQVNPVAFLDKDLSKLKIRQAIELAFVDRPHRAEEGEEAAILTDELFLKVGNKYKKIQLKEVLWFELEGKYAYAKTNSSKLPINISLNKLAEKLPKADFIRIHQSYIVNIHRITSVNFVEASLEVDKNMLPIGRKYKKDLQGKLYFL